MQPEGLPKHPEGPLWAAGRDGLPGGLLGSLLHLEGTQGHWENTLNLHLETNNKKKEWIKLDPCTAERK